MFWPVGTHVSHCSGVSFTSLLLLSDWDFAVMEFVVLCILHEQQYALPEMGDSTGAGYRVN